MLICWETISIKGPSLSPFIGNHAALLHIKTFWQALKKKKWCLGLTLDWLNLKL